ncbi:hypothetical protein Fcan01_15322 [Folsomia candida]|uniref:Uncharacterized protein n=1 Tax=Folsomia candida TaxID=158441 RepID=A0A226DVA8_FOLCA|nr:hypothetical protein Fcan01_15322 [Folsomia candida]
MKGNSMKFLFERNSTHFYLRRFEANIFQDPWSFTDMASPTYEHMDVELDDFIATPIGHSYTCEDQVVIKDGWERTVYLGDGGNQSYFEAFRENRPNQTDFSPGT